MGEIRNLFLLQLILMLKYMLFVNIILSVSLSLCRDIGHVDFRAENFEPYLSQVLKIRWVDELGKKNPLADREYR